MSSSSDDIPLDSYGLQVERDLLNSRIVGLFLESLLFGVFLVTYFMGIWSLICGDQLVALWRRNRILIGVSTSMFVLALVHLSLTVKITLSDFVTHGATRQTVDDAIFDSEMSPQSVAQFYLYVTQTLLGDGFMVYRIYVLWNARRAVFIGPVILFVLDVLSGYLYVLQPVIFSLVFFGISFFTNALSSILIMWRVLRSEGGSVQAHWKWHSRALLNLVKYRRVLGAIIQSAAIYSTASISLFVTLFVSPNIGFYTCLMAFPSLIGLVFSLMVIQIAQNPTSREGGHVPLSTIDGTIHEDSSWLPVNQVTEISKHSHTLSA